MPLSCQQLINRACIDAGVPNYTAQAADKLNMLLADLAQLYDWDILKSFLSITVSSGPTSLGNNVYATYALPSDYLRARKLYYYINGQEFDVNIIPFEQWLKLFQGPGNQTYPMWGGTDLSPLQQNPAVAPNLYLWPTPAQVITLQGLYFRQPPDYANAATNTAIPWFPNQTILLRRLTAELMSSSADKRRGEFIAEFEKWLGDYAKSSNDQEMYAISVGKDPRRFRGGATGATPTKALPL